MISKLCKTCHIKIDNQTGKIYKVLDGKEYYRGFCKSCYKINKKEYHKRTSQHNVERVRRWRLQLTEEQREIQRIKHRIRLKNKYSERIKIANEYQRLFLSNEYSTRLLRRLTGISGEYPEELIELKRNIETLKRILKND